MLKAQRNQKTLNAESVRRWRSWSCERDVEENRKESVGCSVVKFTFSFLLVYALTCCTAEWNEKPLPGWCWESRQSQQRRRTCEKNVIDLDVAVSLPLAEISCRQCVRLLRAEEKYHFTPHGGATQLDTPRAVENLKSMEPKKNAFTLFFYNFYRQHFFLLWIFPPSTSIKLHVLWVKVVTR